MSVIGNFPPTIPTEELIGLSWSDIRISNNIQPVYHPTGVAEKASNTRKDRIAEASSVFNSVVSSGDLKKLEAKKLRIFLAIEQASLREHVRGACKSIGVLDPNIDYAPGLAHSVDRLSGLCQYSPHELIIVDSHLGHPEASGKIILDLVRSQRAAGRVRIMVIQRSSLASDAIHYFLAGADSVLKIPTTTANIREAVKVTMMLVRPYISIGKSDRGERNGYYGPCRFDLDLETWIPSTSGINETDVGKCLSVLNPQSLSTALTDSEGRIFRRKQAELPGLLVDMPALYKCGEDARAACDTHCTMASRCRADQTLVAQYKP